MAIQDSSLNTNKNYCTKRESLKKNNKFELFHPFSSSSFCADEKNAIYVTRGPKEKKKKLVTIKDRRHCAGICYIFSYCKLHIESILEEIFLGGVHKPRHSQLDMLMQMIVLTPVSQTTRTAHQIGFESQFSDAQPIPDSG